MVTARPIGASGAGPGPPFRVRGRPGPGTATDAATHAPAAAARGGARSRRMRLGAVWGGASLARAAQPGLSWGVTLALFLHRTDLRKQEEYGELLQPVIFVLLVLCSVLLYFAVSLMDPGFVESDEEEKVEMNEEQRIMIPQFPRNVRLRRCGYCMLKPMRAKHCQLCQHCVRRYDHHCPWIENCVGERNHPHFIIYLAVQLLVLLWAFHIAWSGLYFEQSWEWLQHNIFLLLSFFLITIFTIVVMVLLVSHLYLVSCDTTTWEFMSRHRISYLRQCESENPFDQGIILNLWRFFCACRLITWEKIYFQEDSDPV
ncbi:palmitoyltransferase ZDHHC12 isoform X2 [Emydura macquarii macquarii]|uniref:palmitoyltransferase ZDHHC12 isoform X2 n=1 Tax=Emydura macquarii macquarii TaxID=1129001 RepID=UPI00352B2C53